MKFDTPIEHCPHCAEYVMLDQTQRECAREHRCTNPQCPLHRFFTGHDFDAAKKRERGGKR